MLRLKPERVSIKEEIAALAAVRGQLRTTQQVKTESPPASTSQSVKPPVVAAAPVPTASAAPRPVAPASTLRRVALVIGNSAYRSATVLNNPSNDAKLIGDTLRAIGIQDVTVLFDLGRTDMLAALNAFSDKADNADWAVIYYSGHGVELDKRNFLVPTDARFATEKDVQDEGIDLDRVLSSVKGARDLRMVVLDACRDNPFSSLASRQKSIGGSRGLGRPEPGDGTLVVYAAREGTVAFDGGGKNSPFAIAFASRIVEPGLELNMAMRFVRNDVLAATNRKQQPFDYGSLPPTPMYFVPPK